MNAYRVTFVNGSTDLVEADSASEAKRQAEADFGESVSRVELLEAFEDDESDEDEDEDEYDEEDEDEGRDDEDDED
ncbi:MAG: hypothetical protein HS116_19315 [Planctomycetes bacterium]|nr:hypothetical protein [Planctomycetota bacterium]